MATTAEVLKPFLQPMASIGFRRAGAVYLASLNDDAEGFVGLNSARRGYPSDSASLVPAIGVRFRSVAELLSRAGFPQAPHAPTIVTQLQPLASPGEYTDLVVSLSDQAGYGRVVELVERFGVPFMEAHQTLESGLDASIEGLGHYTHFTTPVFEFLLGHADEAVQQLESLSASVEGKSGAWSEHVRAVASQLLVIMRRGA